MLFVHHFPRSIRENWPTQRQIPVEYGLKCYFLLTVRLTFRKTGEVKPRSEGSTVLNFPE